MTIDATTQPGYAGTPLVEITGLLAGTGAVGLDIDAPGTTVKGLIIDGFDTGVELAAGAAPHSKAIGSVSTITTLTLNLGNTTVGIDIPAGSVGSTIGGTASDDGNVLSENVGPGIIVAGNDNSLRDNFIGTDPTGFLAFGNSVGVDLSRRPTT